MEVLGNGLTYYYYSVYFNPQIHVNNNNTFIQAYPL